MQNSQQKKIWMEIRLKHMGKVLSRQSVPISFHTYALITMKRHLIEDIAQSGKNAQGGYSWDGTVKRAGDFRCSTDHFGAGGGNLMQTEREIPM